MTIAWSPDRLALIDATQELEIATKRADGSLRRWVPIWVVVFDEQVYVRTWHRRDTGWFGRAVRSPYARVRVPGLEVDVAVADVGADDPELRTGVDTAYRAKYGRHGNGSVARMVSDDAAAATLRLDPD